MANSVIDVAKEAFANANYHLAMDLFEQILRFETHPNENGPSLPSSLLMMDTYFGYADSLARTGNIKESFDVYAFICGRMGHAVPLDRLKHLTIGLLDSVSSMRHMGGGLVPPSGPSSFTTFTSNNYHSNNHYNKRKNGSNKISANGGAMAPTQQNNYKISDSANDADDDADDDASSLDSTELAMDHLNGVDPLACAICEDVLMWPVTTVCGHTFCRQCSYGQTQCRVCGKKFLMYGDSFKQDVLISRLVEKWWTPDIQAQLINVNSKAYLRQNLLDDALKSCNASLEKSKFLAPRCLL